MSVIYQSKKKMVLRWEKGLSASSSDGDSVLQGTQNLLRLKSQKHHVTINKSGFYGDSVFRVFPIIIIKNAELSTFFEIVHLSD